MKYAIIKLSGQQFKVSEGDTLEVDRVDQEEGKTFKIDDVLLVVDEGKVKIGTPLVKGVSVKAKILEHKKDEKIEVRRFKAKSRYRRKKGHRQPISLVKVEKIYG